MQTRESAAIKSAKRLSETHCITRLLKHPPYDAPEAESIKRQASGWVHCLRGEIHQHTLLDTFLAEYGLSSEEGVALMCLAEAFLRIPDAATADLLMHDKLASKDWQAHLGHADSWLVNSSTWALMLTGRTLTLGQNLGAGDWFNGLVGKLGRPLVQRAMRTAMHILGKEFVLGETIDAALARTQSNDTTAYSFDMLGEGARERTSAGCYLEAYKTAIVAVGQAQTQTPADQDEGMTNSVSIKISALHPRYEPLQQSSSEPQLFGVLMALCRLAKKHRVPISIDAEEAERLQFSLDLFAQLCRQMTGWHGLGIVVQAYGKSAPEVIEWLAILAEQTDRCIPVRLVKGAYWDSEIKRAQELGLAEYPVYTRKATTDAAYLSCASRLIKHKGLLYPQFATHNAHTVAAVLNMAGAGFECQRLHGMGEHLYDVVRRDFPQLKVRVYAPVGNHTDLLAYLVRRLLENGANTSFVNRLLDAELDVGELLRDPFVLVREYQQAGNPHIGLPAQIYGSARKNSSGLDLSDAQVVRQYWRATPPRARVVHSLTVLTSQEMKTACSTPVERRSPADQDVSLGVVQDFPLSQIDRVFAAAAKAQVGWDARGGTGRAQTLDRLADLIEAKKGKLYNLLCHEAGKTIGDCVDEVREAVDFCRFYAAEGRAKFSASLQMPGPTGETNQLSLHGRGVWVCISPWNFPLAIFLGQISAALMAGNSVIAKPAESTPGIAGLAMELLYEAGVPKDVCQLVLGGQALGEALVVQPLCGGVAFTGSTAVARQINLQLARRDGAICPLIAETGGQNAMIVDSSALLEQVTDDVLGSAFLSSGQRCSALRVLCLQQDIAAAAIDMIKGAMLELRVGHPRVVNTDMGPIITAHAREGLLAYIQDCRDRGLVVFSPEMNVPHRGHYMAPTLVEISSLKDLRDEQFGPVLHVLHYAHSEVEALVHAINATGHGLTFGVHSRLDERADELAALSRAGNVYINRNMTGASVGTQPFGGQGLSGTGPKAGGPFYLQRFAVEKTVTRNVTATGGNVALLS